MAITAARSEEFETFLSQNGYELGSDDVAAVLLHRSFRFISTLSFCVEGSTLEGQCHLAYAMRSGGQFSPDAIAEDKALVKKGIGRNAITKEWQVNDELSGTDSLTMLKKVPMAYAELKHLLCDELGVQNFDLVR